MTLYELLDLAQSISSRNDVQWGFFITIHLAILGGIIYVDRPLKRAEKFVGFSVYSLFAFFNFRILITHQELLVQIYGEVARMRHFEGPGADLATHYKTMVMSGQTDEVYWITMTIHVLSLLIVLASFITDGPRKKGAEPFR